MLRLKLPENEYYDEVKNRFIVAPSRTLVLEHSLKSVARWESKWNIPFLGDKEKSREQTLDYIRCMSVNQDIEPELLARITNKELQIVTDYINAKMTATTITRRKPPRPTKEVITAEIIYWWMIQYGIPPEYEKWHLNRLLMLVEVCSEKGGPQQKMGMKDQMAQQRALNKARQAQYKTRG